MRSDLATKGGLVTLKARCKAKTKAGKRCAAPATGSGFCNLHSHPGRASGLGRRGGLLNRHSYPPVAEAISAIPNTGAEIRALLAHAIADVKSGHTDPRIGTALAYMASALLKAIEIEELEVRIERLQSKRGLDLLGIGGDDKDGQHD